MADERQRVRIGGGWKNTTRNGKVHLDIPLTPSSKIQLWPNDHKRGEKDPDFIAYMVEVQPRKQETSKDMDDDDSMPF